MAKVTVSMSLEDFEAEKKAEFTRGGTRGQRELLHILTEFHQKRLPREAIQRGSFHTPETWGQLQAILDALEWDALHADSERTPLAVVPGGEEP